MSCCQLVVGDGYVAWMCTGDPDERMAAAFAAAYGEPELRHPLASLLGDDCPECGRCMFEDTPGVLECLCGERLRRSSEGPTWEAA